MLPSALVIGPMKAGTTWIHNYLSWRGDVCLPEHVKETFFFDRYAERGTAWYAGHFRHHDAARHRATLEVAPSLFHCEAAPARVAEVLGAVPLVVTTREPVSRSWSHYQHLRRKGHTRLPFPEAIRRFPEIVEASRYDAGIARWRGALGAVPVTVLGLETLRSDPAVYVERLCDALGLETRLPPPGVMSASNAAGVAPSFALARLGRTVGDGLRHVGAYRVVNAAKRMGLKRVFFGGSDVPGSAPAPTEEERRILRAALELEERS